MIWSQNRAVPGGLNSQNNNQSVIDETEMLRAAMNGNKLRVGIVGAGFSGLRCADVLLQHGHSPVIFEARNRVGGRVGQSNHLGHAVDLGPNWIHGTENNPIMDIAQKTGTELHGWDENQRILDIDGTTLSPEDAMQYGQILWDDGLIAAAFKYSRDNTATIPVEESLMDFFVKKAQDHFTDLPPQEAEKKRKTLLHICEFWGSYVGSPTTRQSLKFFWLEECIDGENPFVAGTYTKILAHVAKPALEKADIRLEHRVTAITSRKDTGEKPTITTHDGKTEEFDEVVVTAPLGWLKRNKDVFKSGLTPRMEKAIDSIGYGSLDKIYITFPSAFWEESSSSSSTDKPRLDTTDKAKLNTSNTTVNVAATTTPLHQPQSSQSSSNYPGFTHWLKPRYAQSTNPKEWDQQAMNLAALPGDSSHPTLLFYIYGDCSAHVGALVRDTPASSLDATLISFLEPYFSRLPNYDTNNSACKPKAVFATAWAVDEFAGFGSYCNFQVGLEHADQDIETMRYGMPEQGVWFAGEHTAPFVALGTSTGAWWSGEAVGLRIVKSAAGLD